jgi:hypothetical protein
VIPVFSAGLLIAAVAVVLLGSTALDAGAEDAGYNLHPVRLTCEGTCPGVTAHEPDGSGTATCRGCGTPRTHPGPDEA